MEDSSPRDAGAARWKAAYFSLFAGQSFSKLGTDVVQFALIWHITITTGSGTALALATLAGLLPQILLGPLGGVVADRTNRKLVMAAADGLIALLTLGLAFSFFSGAGALWQIYLIMALRSAAGAFQHPAATAVIPQLVPSKHLARVAGLAQSVNGGIGIVAPILGALCVAALPLGGIMLIDVATAIPAIAIVLALPIPRIETPAVDAEGTRGADVTSGTEGTAKRRGGSFLAGIAEGVAYVKTVKGLGQLVGLALLLNFILTPVGALMPLFVKDHFARGAVALSFAEAFFGGGMIAGGLLLAVWGGFRNRMVTSILGIVLIGVPVAVSGFLPPAAFPVFLGAFGVTAAGMSLANGPIAAIMQSRVERGMLGRVSSLVNTGATAAMPLALLVCGPLSDLVGVAPLYAGAGIVSLAVALVSFLSPGLRELGEPLG